jgi:hypothetical protein
MATSDTTTQPISSTPAAAEKPERLDCVRFGCIEPATWIVTDPRGGLLLCCDADLDDVLNDALSAIPLHSTARIEVYRA